METETFNPEVKLVRRDATDSPNGGSLYAMHVTTQTDSTSYRGVTHENLSYDIDIDEEGARTVVVKLFMLKDSDSIIDKPYEHPIAWVGDLAGIPLNDESPQLRIELHERISGQDSTMKKGSKTVHIASADENGMPLKCA